MEKSSVTKSFTNLQQNITFYVKQRIKRIIEKT